MKHKVEGCTVVLRAINHRRGVDETNVEVASLEELYDYCLSLTEPRLLERLVLVGRDEGGRERAVNFMFQSITQLHKG